jgi:ubiquinone/menaquinone biosynthesis C-methylase UbiE
MSEEWGKRSAEIWDNQAQFWDERASMWDNGPRAQMLSFFYEQIGDGDLKVLDFGCGPGESTKRMKEKGYQTFGVDQSIEMVNAAKARGLEAYQSDGEKLPFEDETFDAIFVCTSLEWSAEPNKIIAEIARVLKPGGKVLAITLGAYAHPRRTAYERLYGKPVIHNMMMPWELLQLLEDHGLQCVDMKGTYSGENKPPLDVIDQLGDNWMAKAAMSFLWGFSSVK